MTNHQSINFAAMRSPDSAPVLGTTPASLDLEQVGQHATRAAASGRYHGPTDPLEYLHANLCVAEADGVLCATIAGLVCFGRDPQAVLPRAVVDLGHYHGLDAVSFEVVHLEKSIGGTIFSQIARVESYLWANTHHGMTVVDRFERTELHEYPRVVLRELSVNMLAHRDYSNFLSAARVQLFRNRIEWLSPGGLPPGITVDNLLTEQASRNPVILSVLYEAGLVEAFGQGLDTVVTVLKREALTPPVFRDTGASFMVTVAGRPWELFTTENNTQLNEWQRRIIAFIRSEGAIALSDLQQRFGEDRSRRSIQRDLQMLVDARLITARGEGRALRYLLMPANSTATGGGDQG